MQTAATESNNTPGRDLFFKCEHCATPFVVDIAAAGMQVTCQRCGKSTAVPVAENASRATAPSDQLAELQRHLKENDSQRTEVKGYINQLSIQLHRWQLRLQTLEARHQELASKLAGLKGGV